MTSKKLTRTAVCVTAAVLLGYIESLFPPVVPIPGIKIGLANMIIIVLLYADSEKSAWAVSVMKVILTSVLFGTATSFIYSMCGAVLSLLVMCIAKKTRIFSAVGVSSLGGIFHNLGQLICAYFFVGKGAVLYMPVLCLTGAVCGVLTGLSAQLMIKRGGNLFGKE